MCGHFGLHMGLGVDEEGARGLIIEGSFAEPLLRGTEQDGVLRLPHQVVGRAGDVDEYLVVRPEVGEQISLGWFRSLAVDDAGWTREKVSFDAVHGNERVNARLFLPRNAEVRESLDWLDKYLGPVRH